MSAGRNKSKERGELPRVGEVEEFGRGKRRDQEKMRREKKGEQKAGRELGRDRPFCIYVSRVLFVAHRR